MRNSEDKTVNRWSQRPSLVFQTAERILHILKQLSVVCLDFCFTIFDRVLENTKADEQISLKKPPVLETTLLCQCYRFLTSALTPANYRAGSYSSVSACCLPFVSATAPGFKSHPLPTFMEQAEWMLNRELFARAVLTLPTEKQLIWRGSNNA